MNNVESITERLPKSARTVKAEDIAAEIDRQLAEGSIDSLYRLKILSQRTRQYEVKAGGKKSQKSQAKDQRGQQNLAPPSLVNR